MNAMSYIEEGGEKIIKRFSKIRDHYPDPVIHTAWLAGIKCNHQPTSLNTVTLWCCQHHVCVM